MRTELDRTVHLRDLIVRVHQLAEDLKNEPVLPVHMALVSHLGDQVRLLHRVSANVMARIENLEK